MGMVRASLINIRSSKPRHGNKAALIKLWEGAEQKANFVDCADRAVTLRGRSLAPN